MLPLFDLRGSAFTAQTCMHTMQHAGQPVPAVTAFNCLDSDIDVQFHACGSSRCACVHVASLCSQHDQDELLYNVPCLSPSQYVAVHRCFYGIAMSRGGAGFWQLSCIVAPVWCNMHCIHIFLGSIGRFQSAGGNPWIEYKFGPSADWTMLKN